jgi:hypothetical protein
MSKQSSTTKHTSRKTLFFLIFLSTILFIFSFSYFIFLGNSVIGDTPYYKIEGLHYSNFSTITQKIFWSKQELLKGSRLFTKKVIKGNFIAISDDLGIIAIPFNTYDKSVNDRLVFRLKQAESSSWYYQETYDVRQIQNGVPFPFGFPVIRSSRNNSYIFEIESLSGTTADSLSISDKSNYIIVRYKFSRSEIIGNFSGFLQFLSLKVNSQLPLLQIKQIAYILLISFSPFIICYILTLLKRWKTIRIMGRMYKKKIEGLPLISVLSNFFNLFKKSFIFSGLDRESKIKLCSLIIVVGFFLSIAFHYSQGTYYKLSFPQNTFLPSSFFGDFYGTFDEWNRFKFNGVGYGLSYFPSTYLIINLLTSTLTIYNALIVTLVGFTVFMFIFTYKNIRTESVLESLQNTFIILMMSYPFLIAFQTGNAEIITFICISIFFIFYSRHRLLSLIFLSYAISMKIFPGIFLILPFLEKRYKDILISFTFVIIFTLLPLLIFDGGFNKGIGNYIVHLKQSQAMYVNLMIIGGAGNHYGHSLLNGLRVMLPWLFPSMVPIMFPYQIFILAISLLIVGYLMFVEKVFWRKVAILVMMMNLFPFTSTDYKLLYIFLPLFLFINYPKKEKYDFIFLILFSLLLIPKDYFYFNDWPLATFNVVANPIIMLIILLLIILSGLAPYLKQKNRIE